MAAVGGASGEAAPIFSGAGGGRRGCRFTLAVQERGACGMLAAHMVPSVGGAGRESPMHDLGVVARIVIVIGGFPVAVWLGALLTREGRPLARVVERHGRVMAAGLILLNMCVNLLKNEQNARVATALELGTIYLLAAGFVPLMRGLQRRADRVVGARRVN